MTDSAEQTRAVLAALAEEDRPVPDLEPWQGLQVWLASTDARVTIPYAKTLAAEVPAVAVRIRRDFGTVLNLIRAHALLHQASRQRDASGRIVATLDDYRVVRDLIADLVSDAAGATVAPTVRETVEAVSRLGGGGGEVTVTAVAAHLHLDQSAAWRRVQVCLRRGYLRNLEDRPRRPARLVLGDAVPDDAPILPTTESLQVCTADDGDARGPAKAESDIEAIALEAACDPQWAAWVTAPPPEPAGDEIRRGRHDPTSPGAPGRPDGERQGGQPRSSRGPGALSPWPA